MTTSLVVVGDRILRELLCLAATNCQVSCDSCELEECPNAKCLAAETLIFILPGVNPAQIADPLRALRLAEEFRGRIIILTFAPQRLVADKVYGALLESARCYVVPLPFTIEDLCAFVSANEQLSEQALSQIRQEVGTAEVARLAGLIRHDYENKFSLALAHLRAIEKFRHFDQPDPALVAREIKQVRLHLQSAKLESFDAEVDRLNQLARALDIYVAFDSVGPLTSHWEALCELFDQADDATSPQSDRIFERSKQMQEALRSLLSFVARIKEEALRTREPRN